MGYAHDIHLHRDFDRKAFAAAAADIRTLLRCLEIPLAGPTGRPETLPVVEDDFIAFNGLNHACVCDPEDPEYHTFKRCNWRNECNRSDNDSAQPFVVNVGSGVRRRAHSRTDYYWFDCKTRYLQYDLAVMVSMIALKHQLGEQIVMYSKAAWQGGWKYAPRHPGGAVGVYEHVFPERAPVRNILDQDEYGWD